MLQYAINQTTNFLQSTKRESRRKIGQYFTGADLAIFGVSFFDDLKQRASSITVIDPGAGTGVLSAAFATQFENQNIHLIAYETDKSVIPVLKSTLQYIQEKHKSFSFDIKESDYLKEEEKERADYVICNPPYKKINPKSTGIAESCHVSNLYAAFMVRAVQDLRENGEMLFIVPRSWTAGIYFRQLREFLTEHCPLQCIHIFHDRKDIFNTELILQDVVLAKFKKTKTKTLPILTVSESTQTETLTNCMLPEEFCSWGKGKCLLLPQTKEESIIIQDSIKLKTTMKDFGFIVRTGVTVKFRAKDRISEEQTQGTIPLITSDCLSHGFNSEKVSYLNPKKNEKLQNQWYVLFRRICPKENQGQMTVAIYDPAFFNEDFISIELSLLFIPCQTKEDCEMIKDFLEGVACQAFNHSIQSGNDLSAKTISEYPFEKHNLTLKHINSNRSMAT